MKIEELRAGDELLYSGELLLMRDAAQKRLKMLLEEGEELPVSLDGAIIFYAGPAKPTKDSFGAIGPTTSNRMDAFLEMLYLKGVLATVGKGKRGQQAVSLCKEYGRAYFLAPSGAAAALAHKEHRPAWAHPMVTPDVVGNLPGLLVIPPAGAKVVQRTQAAGPVVQLDGVSHAAVIEALADILVERASALNAGQHDHQPTVEPFGRDVRLVATAAGNCRNRQNHDRQGSGNHNLPAHRECVQQPAARIQLRNHTGQARDVSTESLARAKHDQSAFHPA